jgi:hypothetical protein
MILDHAIGPFTAPAVSKELPKSLMNSFCARWSWVPIPADRHLRARLMDFSTQS